MKRLVMALFVAITLSCLGGLPVPALAASVTAAAAAPLNLNEASAKQLQSLPGIGEVTAAHILAYRKGNGAFKRVDDLLQVKGVGPKTLARIRALVTVE